MKWLMLRNRFCLRQSVLRSCSTCPGLFSIAELQKPNDFEALAQKSMQKIRLLHNSLQHLDEPVAAMRALDDISNEVCKAIDVADFCRSIHYDSSFRSAATESFTKLHACIQQLNSDPAIYEKICEIHRHNAKTQILDEEDYHFICDMKAELENEGIHLTGNDKATAAILHEKVSKLETSFTHNVTHSNCSFVLGPIPKEYFSNTLSFASQYVTQPPELTEERKVLLSMNPSFLRVLLASLVDTGLRQEIHARSYEHPANNKEVLGQLIQERQKYAKLLGYESYAHKALSRTAIRDPREASKLLKSMSQAILPEFEQCMNVLLQLKRALLDRTGQSSVDAAHVFPYDEPLLLEYHRITQQSSNIAEYFHIDCVLNGLAMICDMLFGIEMRPLDVHPSESWLEPSDKSLMKFGFYSGGACLGIVYFDIFARLNKFPGSAHFTLRAGYNSQTPIIALVLSLQGNHLHLSGLESLYHEFGHALHSLLSRTKYQHLAGTRGATDFVEVPSHLFEYFARDPRILTLWAKRSSDGASLPVELAHEALATRNAMAPAAFNADSAATYDKCSASDVYDQLCKQAIELCDEYGVPFRYRNNQRSMDMTGIRLCEHNHFVNYGGTYYAYLFANMYAAQIWHTNFACDPLNRETGTKLWNMLKYGAARPPIDILATMSNGPLDPKFYMQTLRGNKLK